MAGPRRPLRPSDVRSALSSRCAAGAPSDGEGLPPIECASTRPRLGYPTKVGLDVGTWCRVGEASSRRPSDPTLRSPGLIEAAHWLPVLSAPPGNPRQSSLARRSATPRPRRPRSAWRPATRPLCPSFACTASLRGDGRAVMPHHPPSAGGEHCVTEPGTPSSERRVVRRAKSAQRADRSLIRTRDTAYRERGIA